METPSSPSPAPSRRRLTVPRLAAWVAGLALFVAAADALTDFNIPSGALFVLAATFLVPPVYEGVVARAKAKSKKPVAELGRGGRVTVAVALAAVGLMLSGLDEALSSPPGATTPSAAPVTEVSAPEKTAPLEQSIRDAMPESVRGRLRGVKLVPYEAADASRRGLSPEAVGVIVELDGSDNFTARMIKGSAYSDAEKVFDAAFGASNTVADVSAQFYYPTADKYGQESESLGIIALIARPLYEKVNWENFDHHELPTLLRDESSADDRNGYIERLKFE